MEQRGRALQTSAWCHSVTEIVGSLQFSDPWSILWYPKGVIWRGIKILFTKTIYISWESQTLPRMELASFPGVSLPVCETQKAAPATTAPLCMPRAGSAFWVQCQLFVRPQKSGNFGAQQPNEGSGEHLSWLLGCVLEVVLWMCQHVKQCFYQLLVLGKGKQILQ